MLESGEWGRESHDGRDQKPCDLVNTKYQFPRHLPARRCHWNINTYKYLEVINKPTDL